MKKIIAIVSILLALNVSANEAWRCSNWMTGFSDVLVFTKMRSTVVVMNKATASSKQANKDLEAAKLSINKFKAKNNVLKTEHSLKLNPVVVKKDNQYVVILDEFLTAGEASVIQLEFMKDGREFDQLEFTKNLFQEIPKPEEKSTCDTSISDSYAAKYILGKLKNIF
ncbi:MAG: hypothetical protein EHM20_06280 [Alphaproteobacteria bacterium]|nr:MAG: hypothetical protein EHM20_06280 [Alphaproteobacteria bacterium]